MGAKRASEEVIVQAPMSYTGSTRRLWRLTRISMWMIPLIIICLVLAWAAVTCWYVIFGILLLPYRVIRHGARKNKRDQLRHRELLEAMRPDVKP